MLRRLLFGMLSLAALGALPAAPVAGATTVNQEKVADEEVV